jgi:hypothetical protein
MGYSLDNGSVEAIITSQSINTSVTASAGNHTLHVSAWATGGYTCVKDVTINVTSGGGSGPGSGGGGGGGCYGCVGGSGSGGGGGGGGGGSGGGSTPPSNAESVSTIEALSGWQTTHDTGGPGSSTGSTYLVSSPSMDGSAREFVTTFQDSADQRFSVSFSDNTSAKNFFYDGWVYLTSSSSDLANIELDMNQVMPDGDTALMGVQCDGYSGNWAYNENLGTNSFPQPHWQSVSGTTCNPRNWSQYTWHHIQARFSRTDSGTVTYQSVWLDGVETQLNVQAYCAATLGWVPVMKTQFQLDGLGSSGTITAYLDDLTLYMW